MTIHEQDRPGCRALTAALRQFVRLQLWAPIDRYVDESVHTS